MATTTPDSLYYPLGTDAVAPLNTVLATMQGSVQQALLRYPVSVANATERNSLFPTPTQGLRVLRRDTGAEEIYLAAYNATSNPGGSVLAAGWYPYAGRMPYARLRRASAFNWSSNTTVLGWDSTQQNIGNAVTVTGTDVTLNYGGVWAIDIVATIGSTGSQYANVILGMNGSTSNRYTSATIPSANANSSTSLSINIEATAGTTIQTYLHSNSSGTGVTANDGGAATFVSFRYLGPA